MSKRFRVDAIYTSTMYLTTEIEAESIEEAEAVANQMAPDEFEGSMTEDPDEDIEITNIEDID